MTIPLNYQKRKNTHLFQSFENHKAIQLSNLQNYIPIYKQLFALNNNNFNSINLNHLWTIRDINEKSNSHKGNDNIFTCKLQNMNSSDITFETSVFFKMAPLLDPCKYIIGKYNHTDPNLFNLPSLNDNNIHSKILHVHNCSYVDGFFVFLTSQLLNF